MSIFNYLYYNIINPLQSIPSQLYYTYKKNYNLLNSSPRENQIIVSLTSFPPRFSTLHFTLKSILNQSMIPDAVILYLAKEEISNESELPKSILALKKFGLKIEILNENLKPHKKYFYSMSQFPDSIIITIDDDVIYDSHLIRDLYNSYIKFPKAVSGTRVHKILCDDNTVLLPYNKWLCEYNKELNPSFKLITTGVGGVLFPPNILPQETFNIEKIKDLCLNADDIWLKFMELKNDIPVVYAKSKRKHPLIIKKAQKKSLQKGNYHENQNDKYINILQKYYNIDLSSICGE